MFKKLFIILLILVTSNSEGYYESFRKEVSKIEVSSVVSGPNNVYISRPEGIMTLEQNGNNYKNINTK